MSFNDKDSQSYTVSKTITLLAQGQTLYAALINKMIVWDLVCAVFLKRTVGIQSCGYKALREFRALST